MITVAIVDDHAIVTDGLEKIISESGTCSLVGKAGSVAGCLELLAGGQPGDVGLPDGSGMDLCPRIKAQYPAMNILMLTSYAEYAVISHVLNNGASGYIVKSEAVGEVLEAIRAVTNGDTYVSRQMEQMIRKTTRIEVSLTPREKQVLQMVAIGMNNPQIAEHLKVALSTVLSFRKKLNLKLNASNPVELLAGARREGLID